MVITKKKIDLKSITAKKLILCTLFLIYGDYKKKIQLESINCKHSNK